MVSSPTLSRGAPTPTAAMPNPTEMVYAQLVEGCRLAGPHCQRQHSGMADLIRFTADTSNRDKLRSHNHTFYISIIDKCAAQVDAEINKVVYT